MWNVLQEMLLMTLLKMIQLMDNNVIYDCLKLNIFMLVCKYLLSLNIQKVSLIYLSFSY